MALAINHVGTAVYILHQRRQHCRGLPHRNRTRPGPRSSPTAAAFSSRTPTTTRSGATRTPPATSSRPARPTRFRPTARTERSSSATYIGTDVTGLVELGNGGGITLASSTNARIGGGGSGDRNVISGIQRQRRADLGRLWPSSIAGNLIGTDVTGTQRLAEHLRHRHQRQRHGFRPSAAPSRGEGNVISGNGSSGGGLGLILNGTDGVTIQGNKFGTDITGTLPLPNPLAILINTLSQHRHPDRRRGPGRGQPHRVQRRGIPRSRRSGTWACASPSAATRSTTTRGSDSTTRDQGVNPQRPVGRGRRGQRRAELSAHLLRGADAVGTAGCRDADPGLPAQYALLHVHPRLLRQRRLHPAPPGLPRGDDLARRGRSHDRCLRLGPLRRRPLPVAITPGDFVSATATDTNGNTSEFSQRLPFSLFPTSGDAAGGSQITIQGTDFAAGATVTIGGQPASNVNVQSGTLLTAQTPAARRGHRQRPDRDEPRPHHRHVAEGLGLGLPRRPELPPVLLVRDDPRPQRDHRGCRAAGCTASTSRRCASRWQSSC